MNNYIVLYRCITAHSKDAPSMLRCGARDRIDAENQCIDHYPDCEVLWVAETDSSDTAYREYYASTLT